MSNQTSHTAGSERRTSPAARRPAPAPGDLASLSDAEIAALGRRRRTAPIVFVSGALGAALAAGLLWSFLTNPRWGWDVVAEYLFDPVVLRGLGTTLLLTAISVTVAFIVGGVIAFMRLSSSRVLQFIAGAYVWIIRSTPLLLQLLLWYNVSYLYERITIGIPLLDDPIIDIPTVSLIGPFGAALLGLSLNSAAYCSEIIRGGLLSVPVKQREAAEALGIGHGVYVRRILLPQAMRTIMPGAINEIVAVIKGTSIVSVLSILELFYTVQVLYARNAEVLPLLLVATAWYIVLTSLLTILQRVLERRFGRGVRRDDR